MVLDYSMGGVRLSVDSSFQRGEQVRVFLRQREGEEIAILGRTKWALNLETGNLIGVEVHRSNLECYRGIARQYGAAVVRRAMSNFVPLVVGPLVASGLALIYWLL